MITYKQGNLFDSNCQTLVCTVNCEGVMGKGIALEFKKNFPEMFTKYRDVCLYDKTQLKHGGDLWLYRYPDLEQFTLWDTDGHLNTGRQSRVLCFATKGEVEKPIQIGVDRPGTGGVRKAVQGMGCYKYCLS